MESFLSILISLEMEKIMFCLFVYRLYDDISYLLNMVVCVVSRGVNKPSRACSGSTRLIFNRTQARAELLLEPQYCARARLIKKEPELELGSTK
jgi:hypothetical protein